MALLRVIMNQTVIALLFTASVALAGFSDDQFAEPADVLSRIVRAAETAGSQFRSCTDGDSSYSLRRAEYIGPCEAPFGTVHIARLFFVRSAPKGSKLPARGHTFIVFLDHEFAIRSYWTVNIDFGQLSVKGSKLLLDHKVLFDFAYPPGSGQIAAEGIVLGVPQWK
jgi:hypothetical protein